MDKVEALAKFLKCQPTQLGEWPSGNRFTYQGQDWVVYTIDERHARAESILYEEAAERVSGCVWTYFDLDRWVEDQVDSQGYANILGDGIEVKLPVPQYEEDYYAYPH